MNELNYWRFLAFSLSDILDIWAWNVILNCIVWIVHAVCCMHAIVQFCTITFRVRKFCASIFIWSAVCSALLIVFVWLIFLNEHSLSFDWDDHAHCSLLMHYRCTRAHTTICRSITREMPACVRLEPIIRYTSYVSTNWSRARCVNSYFFYDFYHIICCIFFRFSFFLLSLN